MATINGNWGSTWSGGGQTLGDLNATEINNGIVYQSEIGSKFLNQALQRHDKAIDELQRTGAWDANKTYAKDDIVYFIYIFKIGTTTYTRQVFAKSAVANNTQQPVKSPATKTGLYTFTNNTAITGDISAQINTQWQWLSTCLGEAPTFYNTKVLGTLATTGATTLSSTLAVTGATTLNSTLTASKALTTLHSLKVAGASTLAEITGTTLTTTGNVAHNTATATFKVAGPATFGNSVEVAGKLSSGAVSTTTTPPDTAASNEIVTAEWVRAYLTKAISPSS